MTPPGESDAALLAAARGWYHRALPGGMPIDWINDHRLRNDPRTLVLATLAAGLSWDDRLHLTETGAGTSYPVAHLSDCVLCRVHR